jgi:site-specific DNA-methyltransferase (adenine-specific)
MTATLLYGDCLEMMKDLPDKSVDCFICDLPYGQLAPGQGGKLDSEKYGEKRVSMANTTCAWDIKIDLKAFWEQVERLAKADNTPVIHFCNTKFGIDLIISKPDWFRYDLVWNKERGVSFLLANKMPMKSHEMIYIFSKKGAYYKRVDIKTDKGDYKIKEGIIKSNTYLSPVGVVKDGKNIIKKVAVEQKDGMRCSLSVINIVSKIVRNGHPTEKPKELYEWLLSRYCPEGGTVLDPTAGSFNSIKVAKELGLKGIGIEKDEAFYKIAVEKFKN